MIRSIVVGSITDGPGGLEVINFWARVPITLPARQAFYRARQANGSPAAPGDYTAAGVDAAELSDYREGLFREEPMYDVRDPSLSAAQVEARLVRLANAAVTKANAADVKMLGYFGTYHDGTNWFEKSA